MNLQASKTLNCLFLLLFAFTVVRAQDDVVARKTENELQSMDWKDIVQYYLQTFVKPGDPETKAYTDRLRTLLDHKGTMHIRTYSVVDGEKTDGEQIYFRPGELHVVGATGGIDAEPGEWNLLVRDGRTFEWRTGDSTGLVSDAINKDMIDYLIYLTDVSLIETSVYRDYLRQPDSFLPPNTDEENGWVEIRPKEKNELGIVAVFVADDPFWIYGIEIEQDGSVVRLIHDRPAQIERLPHELFAPLDKIEFRESKKSLRRHLISL